MTDPTLTQHPLLFQAPFHVFASTGDPRHDGHWAIASRDGWVLCRSRAGDLDTAENTQPLMDHIVQALNQEAALAILANPAVTWEYRAPLVSTRHVIGLVLGTEYKTFVETSFTAVVLQAAEWTQSRLHPDPPGTPTPLQKGEPDAPATS